ncbi:MAG: hypothetical protein PHH04_03465 [Thomasclavelia sp.]|nr:hypothetical protein [Thomasclavelia sp.]
MKKFKQYLLVVLFVIGVGFSCGLTLKAAIGVGAWDALAQTGYEITGIEVGTVGMITNFVCVFIQIIVLKKEFRLVQLFQIPLSFILGIVVNFAVYDVYAMFSINNYFMNVVLLITGYILCSFMVGAVMVLDQVTFALEGACMAVSKKTGIEFHKLRTGVDVVSVILGISLAFIFNVPLAIREGTIIGMIIFGPSMGVFMRYQKKWFKKLNLLDYE